MRVSVHGADVLCVSVHGADVLCVSVHGADVYKSVIIFAEVRFELTCW